MAKPTLDSLDRRKPSWYAIYWGSASTGLALSQAKSIEVTASIEVSSAKRIGTDTAIKNKVSKEYTGQIAIYVDNDLAEVGEILGVSKPGSGGWLGSEVIQLDVDAASVDVEAEAYDDEDGTTLLWVEKFTDLEITGYTRGVDADTGDPMITFPFFCSNHTWEPEAGVGA